MAPDRAQALAWRLGRQALDPPAATTATEVAERVLALRGWPAEAADLTVAVRLRRPDVTDLGRGLDAGELVRSYAFRGGSYVFTPEIAALVLCVRSATRVWETRRYQQQGGFAIDDWEPLREEVCTALRDGPLTRGEISARLTRSPLAHLAEAATGTGSDSLYKPLHWWGDICFGPPREGSSTFRLLRDDPRWPGLPPVDSAGPELVVRYLGAYGPATTGNLRYWLTDGLGIRWGRVQAWLAGLSDQLTELDLEGEVGYLLGDDLDDLSATEPSQVVRLLPAFDPWIIGPGTADTRLIARGRRHLFSQGANPVVRGGAVVGTWRIRDRTLAVSWFGECGTPPQDALEEDVDRLSQVRGHMLGMTVSIAPALPA